jgi:hypothetical protein
MNALTLSGGVSNPAPRPPLGLPRRLIYAHIPTLPGYLDTSDLTQIGEGSERVTYAIQGAPHLVAKVTKPDAADGAFVVFREVRAARNAAWPAAPIPPLYGLQQTAFGPALITGRVTAPTGAPAPTLSQLLGTDAAAAGARQTGNASNIIFPRGLSLRHLDALNQFVERLFDSRLYAHDFNPDNLMFGIRWPGEREAFIAVDGFGDRKRLSRRELVWCSARDKMLAHLRKIEKRTALTWNPDRRIFTNPSL